MSLTRSESFSLFLRAISRKLRLRRNRTRHAADHQPEGAADRRQRGAQLVTDRRNELPLQPVDLAQLGEIPDRAPEVLSLRGPEVEQRELEGEERAVFPASGPLGHPAEAAMARLTAAMHYTGMAAMRLPARTRFDGEPGTLRETLFALLDLRSQLPIGASELSRSLGDKGRRPVPRGGSSSNCPGSTWRKLAAMCCKRSAGGYLQKQLHALTGSAAVAVMGQALCFGIAHGYQGWKNVVVIAVLGILYGVLALWRRSTRPGMIAHAWTDVYGGLQLGWLSRVF